MIYWYRRLLSILVLNYWLNMIYTLVTPFTPFNHSSFYFLYIFVPAVSSIFALFITKRKYRLPRKYMITVSLLCSCISMIFLSSAPAVDFTAKIVLNILSKFFIAFAWSSAVYVNITLICSLYSEYFHIIFAMVQSTALCGFACGYYITKYSDLHQVYIGFAVCSMILLLILYQLMGDVNYILSSERYTVVDYLRKPVKFI